MTNKIFRLFRSIRCEYWLLAAIVLSGAFLRAYEFHDWLRFNPDQARDAAVVYDMTKGEIPLLGPVAGGTEFRLGPVTHYFSFLSGLLFGFSPDALAYPDLFFSVLAIPLIFLLVSRLFGVRIGLLAALLVAVSAFMVRYGRFQWNPNTMPFFTTLFLLAGQVFFDREAKRPYVWATLFGISLGVGVQLHTFLLVLLPILTLVLFGYLLFRKSLRFALAATAIGIALLLNIPMILSETRNNFANTTEFFDGVSGETESSRSIVSRAGRDALCHIRANAFVLTGLGHSDDCNRFVATMEKKKPLHHPFDIAHALLEIVFTVGGLFLLGYFAWREQDRRKKFLLASLLLYTLLLFLLVIPVANEIAMRYFLANAFLPFALLGAWGAFFWERGKSFRIAFLVFLALLVVSSGWFLKKEYEFYRSGKVSDGDTAILGETEPLAAFISRNMSPNETAHLIGMRSYRKRFHKALAYPLHIEGKTLLRWDGKGLPTDSGSVFLIRKKTKAFDSATEIDGRPILDRITSGRVSVFLLRRE